MLQQMLSSLHLPPLPDCGAAVRKQIQQMLVEKEYGIIPELDVQVQGRIIQQDERFCAGKCPLSYVELTLTFPGGDQFVLPCRLAMPAAQGRHPLFVLLNFLAETPAPYLPSEEIGDRGFGVFSVNYNDISIDGPDDYTAGLGKLLRDAAAQAGVPQAQLPGKIAVWAWAASRMLDWVLTHPQVDASRVAVIGHSRLGKTALLAGMNDSRFACVISNDSGCSGAAITRGKTGEHVSDIVERFPYWFCEAYHQYVDREDEMPFDQHWLLAAQAPRLLLVGSAVQDEWAGPEHEFLACVEAGKAWETAGMKGFVHPDRMPVAGDVFHDGCVGYHLRAGMHYLSREDWNCYMNFLEKNGWL